MSDHINTPLPPRPVTENNATIQAPTTTETTENAKKKQGVTLKLSQTIQKEIQEQATKYGISQSLYVSALVRRNVQGADEKDFQKLLASQL